MSHSEHTEGNNPHKDHVASATAMQNGAMENGSQTKNTPHHTIVDPHTIDREFKFSFKKQMVKDELGADIKRPPVTLNLPIPTLHGLLNDLGEDSKVITFVLDLLEESVKDQARIQLSDEEKPVNRQEDLDITKLTLRYIANIPKSERTGGGIAKEIWADFEKDYTEVMTPIRTEEKAAKAAALLGGRLMKCRGDKNVLKFLRSDLATWSQKTTQLDDYSEVFKYLDDKATELINREDPNLLANLQ